MRIPRVKHQGIYLLAAVFAAILLYGFWPKPVFVEVGRVDRGDITVTIDEEGRTRVIDRFVISAPVSGYVRRINFKVGDMLEKGVVVVEMEPLRARVLDARSRAEAQAKMSAAEAVLFSAQAKAKAADAEAVLARRNFERIAALYKKKLVSRQQYDTAQADYRRAQANKRSAAFAVKVAQYKLKAARVTLRHSDAGDEGKAKETVKIRAPVKGSILKLHVKSEGVVKEGQPLVEVGDLDALEVVVDVLSSDAVRITPGTKVLFDRWGGDSELSGVVRTVEPVGFTKVSALGVEEQRVKVIVDITSARKFWRRLGDGYRVEAQFVLWRGYGVLRVPSTAVFRRQGRWAVFKVENKRAMLQFVELGRRGGFYVQVRRGLQENDLILTHPDDQVSDGVRVKWRL